MESFESVVALTLEAEEFVVSGAVKFPVSRCWSVPEGGHHVAGGRALPALVRDAGVGEHAQVVAQRCGLRALHVLEPAQVLVGDLAEGHATGLAFALGALAVVCFGHVGGYEGSCRYVGRPLIVGAVGYTPATWTPVARVCIEIEPGRPDAALYLPAAVAELRLEEGLPVVLADDHRGAGVLG